MISLDRESSQTSRGLDVLLLDDGRPSLSRGRALQLVDDNESLIAIDYWTVSPLLLLGAELARSPTAAAHLLRIGRRDEVRAQSRRSAFGCRHLVAGLVLAIVRQKLVGLSEHR